MAIADEWDDLAAVPCGKVEIYWDASWVNESAYLILEGGMSVTRDLVDPVLGLTSMAYAPLGSATLRMRNTDSRYSKSKSGSQANTYGIHNKQIRASLGYSAAYEVIFTGRIVDVSEAEAGATVTLTCHDMGEDLMRQTASSAMSTDQQTDVWIDTLAAAGGLAGADYSTEYGFFMLPYCYLESDKLLSEAQKAAASEGGVIFFDKDGVLQFWNAGHWADSRSGYAFTEALYAELVPRRDYDNKYNVATVEYETRAVAESAVVYNLRRTICVPVNGTRTVTMRFRLPLAEYESYDMAVVSGGGQDMSGDVTLSPTSPDGAQSWTVTFTNANTRHEAFVTKFEVLGKPVEGRSAEEHVYDPNSKAGTDEERNLQIRNNYYIQQEGQALMLAEMATDRLTTEHLVVELRDVPANPLLELGDRVTLTSTLTGVSVDVLIIGLRFTYGIAAKMTVIGVDVTNFYGYTTYFTIGSSALGAASGEYLFY